MNSNEYWDREVKVGDRVEHYRGKHGVFSNKVRGTVVKITPSTVTIENDRHEVPPPSKHGAWIVASHMVSKQEKRRDTSRFLR